MAPDEMLTDIRLPAMNRTSGDVHQAGAAARTGDLGRERGRRPEHGAGHVQRARITLGSVAPTIVPAGRAEAYLAASR